MQLKKLAIMCNGCFWLTIIFQFWKNARNIHPDVLGTIIIIGLLSVVVNLAWLVVAGINKWSKPVAKFSSATNKRPQQVWSSVFSGWFIILSFTAQIILLYLKFV